VGPPPARSACGAPWLPSATRLAHRKTIGVDAADRDDRARCAGRASGRLGRRDVEQVEQVLRNKRDLWQTLNQGHAFPGIVNLGLGPACSMGRLRALLPGLASAGYPSVNMLLTHEIWAHQPFFGPMRGRRWTAVRLRVGTDSSPCDEAAAVSFARSASEQVAPELAHWIELRRSSQDICPRLR
jgi:hypothetical protein